MTHEEELELIAPLRVQMLIKIRDAEKAAYEYFCACPIGVERERAADVYERIRTSTRFV